MVCYFAEINNLLRSSRVCFLPFGQFYKGFYIVDGMMNIGFVCVCVCVCARARVYLYVNMVMYLMFECT